MTNYEFRNASRRDLFYAELQSSLKELRPDKGAQRSQRAKTRDKKCVNAKIEERETR